jgi:hypothetical protein
MKYLGDIFDKENYMENTCINDCHQGPSNIDYNLTPFVKLALKRQYKALIKSIMTYACPTWEFAADSLSFELQRLQNKVL